MSAVAVLYPGEMGGAVARLLAGRGCEVLTCAAQRSARTQTAAEAAGMTTLADLDEVVRRCGYVFSLVPPTAALATAEAMARAAASTGARPLYIDCNSIAPATMAAVAAAVAAAGLSCVDGAFVGGSAGLGAKTVLLLSGEAAPAVVSLVGDAFATAALGDEVGVASACKLAFAAFNKGLVALFLEVVGAAEALGRGEELAGLLRSFYPGTVDTVERLLPSYPRHAGRRADEMAAAVAWQASLGRAAPMTAAARDVIAELARLGLDGEAEWDANRVLEEYVRRRRTES